MVKKNILSLCVLLSCLTLMVDTVDAARNRFKKKNNGTTVQQVGSQARVVIDKDEDVLDIATAEEDGVAGVEPMVVKEEEPQDLSRDEDFFDIPAKRKEVIEIVERGVEYLKKNETGKAFNEFTHTKNFIKGELYLFAFTDKGVMLAHGQNTDLLWKNLLNDRDSFGTPYIQLMIDKAQKGGGWVTYNWRNATKISYVQEVKKDGRVYVVGSGYYPHSKEDAVVNLVKGAVSIFNDMKTQGRPKEEAFSSFNYPMGRFVFGDLYLYALDFKGTIFAQADRPGLVGTNAWDYQDAEGKFSNQEIIKKLKEHPDEGIWTTYISKRAKKKTYAERVVDAKGVNYFIACGYYPSANRQAAVDLVKKGYTYMKAHGKGLASQDFSSKSNVEFRYGDLYLVVYDMKGKCIAHGGNAELIGKNQFDEKDDDGRFFVREMIQKAKDDGGWVDIKTQNSFQSMYVEAVDLGLPENKFVIGCGVFPISKAETMNLLVKSATGYLRLNPEEQSFAEFSKPDGKFIRGDLEVFVFDPTGLCYVYGDTNDLIWQNLLNATDDDGKHYVKLFINTVKTGSGKVTYKLNGVQKIANVDQVEKDNKTYIIGSSFYK